MRRRQVLLTAMTLLVATSGSLLAEPIPVRFVEGATHGFLMLRSQGGETMGQGEVIQAVKDDRVESRLIFRFKDGSLHDENVTFSQQRVFTMLSYHLIQRGPSFPEQLDISMDRKTGDYEVRSREGTEGREEILTGRLELPPDAYNGMAVLLLRNLPAGKSHTVQYVAFTPEPKLITLMLLPVGETAVMIGDIQKQATQYVLEPHLGAITRFFGKLFGKLPADFHYHFWILNDDVPAFVRFEGPLYFKGPNWQIELVSPRWSAKLNEKTRRVK